MAEVDSVDFALQNCTVPIPWLIVTGPLPWLVTLESADPDIVGWVGRVQHSGTTGEKSRIVPSSVV